MPDDLTYARYLLPCLERNAARTMVTTDDGESVTYGDHAGRVLRLAAAMRDKEVLGLGEGETFAALGKASPWYMALWHGALCGGGTINAVNPRFTDSELTYVLRAANTAAMFVDEGTVEAVERVRRDVPSLRCVVGMGEAGGDVHITELAKHAGAWSMPSIDEADIAALNFTGGTTGTPKGVVYSHRAVVMNVLQNNYLFDFFAEGTVHLGVLPMHHIGAFPVTLGMPVSGNLAVLMPVFEPGAAIAAIERHGCTLTGMVPTMLNFILAHPDFAPEKVRTLRTIVYGGAPMPSALASRLLEILPDVRLATGYGTTEAGPITVLGPQEHRDRHELLTTVGRAMPGSQILVGASPAEPAPVGMADEVWVRTMSRMTGYLDQPEATEEVFTDGWYRTGDVGRLDAEGYLSLVDRAKDLIVSGGENVYSLEVENVLAAHPQVFQVAVIGVPDDTWGEAVHAVVVPEPDAAEAFDSAELIAFAEQSLAGFKVPKAVTVRAEPLPVSAAGKVLKRELREPFWAGRERRIGG